MENPQQLSHLAQTAIGELQNDVFISAVVGWEIAIKRGLGKLTAPANLAEAVELSGFQVLPISLRHAMAVENLPWHHRDPFDRLLISQAQLEGMTLVFRDSQMEAYQVSVMIG